MTDLPADDRTALKDAVHAAARENAERAIAVSRGIFAVPELAFEEHHSAAIVADELEHAGFSVQRGVGRLPTAIVAERGTGRLVIGICAEYDALPEIGHACGHNVISGAAVLAALALAGTVDRLGITLRVFGTPAEERGGGKALMLEDGAFDGTDIILMVHPAPHDEIHPVIVAVTRVDVDFIGFTAPAMSPEQARNAGAAATLLEVAVALARQNLRADERISGVNLGAGHSANVVPARSTLSFSLRATSDQRLGAIVELLHRCVEGAAIATATEFVFTEPDPRYGALHHDERLGELYRRNAEALGRVFDPPSADGAQRAAGSDFGNLSARMRAIHPLIGIDADGASNHQAEFAAFCGGGEGDRAVEDAGIALALTIVDAVFDERHTHSETRVATPDDPEVHP